MIIDQVGTSHPIGADIQQVLRAADRATALTRQLLAFSRRQMVQPKVMEADCLVHDMQPMLQRLVSETAQLEIITEAPGARIRIDPGNLEQVVVNLVVNARDAVPPGGLVRIETRSVRAGDNSSFPEGQYYLLEVADNGIGMTEEVLSHLFEPFFTTKERGRGTGLGLSTSYGIVKQNRGEILVRSEPGKGSIFSIYLPLVQDAVEAAPTECGPSVQYRGIESILVAEDEEDVRTVITGMLGRQGYRVLAASRGSEALEIASKLENIDLLITDMVMPGMSGKELADRLLEARPGLRVLFVSGYAESGIVHDGVVESDKNFLQKPFPPEELARKVRAVLDAPAVVRENAPAARIGD
jgi:CheY-like chemotaxis protein